MTKITKRALILLLAVAGTLSLALLGGCQNLPGGIFSGIGSGGFNADDLTGFFSGNFSDDSSFDGSSPSNGEQECAHKFSEWVTTTEATCAAIGKKSRLCIHCGATQTENIPVLTHNYENGKCTICGSPIPSEGLEFTLNDDGESYSVSGIGDCKDTDIIIPSFYNSKPVTSIGEHAFGKYPELTSVVIPDSVTSIYFGAFYDCDGLTSVVIPDSVTSIGENAFFSCGKLTSITIGDSVSFIDNWAFLECYKLVEVINKSKLNIEKGSEDNGGVGYYAITVHDGKSLINNKDGYLFITYNGTNYLFEYTGADTNLVLPDNYNGENYEIYKYTFSDRDDLTNISIPNSVTSIGGYAFDHCGRLNEIKFNGTMAEWKAIDKEQTWNWNVPAKKVICSDGKVDL